MTPGDPVVGGTVLRRPAIQSPNFVEGTAGWSINANGSAEFNNLTARGPIYQYNGTAGAGTLVFASVPPSVTADAYGNAIPGPGETTFFTQGGVAYAITTYGGSVSWYTATSQAGPYTQVASLGLLNPTGPGTLLTSTIGIASGLSLSGIPIGEWQQATPLSNFWTGSGSGVNGLWWRLLASPANTLEIIADIINSTATGNSVVADLPFGVAPATPSNHPAGWNVASPNPGSTPWVFVSNPGAGCQVQLTGIQSADIEIFFHIFVPLDSL